MSQEPSSPFIEPLRDAFAAFALDSTSPPTPLPPNGHGRQLADFNSALTRRRYSEGQREYNLEFQEVCVFFRISAPLNCSLTQL